MNALVASVPMALASMLAGQGLCAEQPVEVKADVLQPPSSFASIADREARSVALFAEAAKAIQSPRCLNCHPVTRTPTQGDDLHAHVPPMDAGKQGMAGQGSRARPVTRPPMSARNMQQSHRFPAIRTGVWRRPRWPGRA